MSRDTAGKFLPIECPHGVLGKKKCKQCDAMRWQRRKHKRDKKKSLASSRRARGIPECGGETRIGPCLLCKRILKLVPDHDHYSGRLRGWICGRCNRFLGIYERLKYDGMLGKFQMYLKEKLCPFLS